MLPRGIQVAAAASDAGPQELRFAVTGRNRFGSSNPPLGSIKILGSQSAVDGPLGNEHKTGPLPNADQH